MVSQNYRVKREVCGTCLHFRFRRETPAWAITVYPNDLARQQSAAVDVGLRCGLGGFPVKRTGTCREWKPGDATKA
mgnify:CR=1 FL=1